MWLTHEIGAIALSLDLMFNAGDVCVEKPSKEFNLELTRLLMPACDTVDRAILFLEQKSIVRFFPDRHIARLVLNLGELGDALG